MIIVALTPRVSRPLIIANFLLVSQAFFIVIPEDTTVLIYMPCLFNLQAI